MRYWCEKQLTAGEVTYHPGEIIPDGVILPERSSKLIRSGYISELNLEMTDSAGSGQERVFTEKEVNAMIADALAEAEKGNEERIAELQGYVAELQEIEPGAYEGTVQISVKSASDGENEQITAIPAKPEEIQQVFSILQMNVEEGIRVITDVTSETVLILLHAADSRKTIKNAVKDRADKLFLAKSDSNESDKGNETTGTNTEGADT